MRKEISPGFSISFSEHGDPDAEPLVLVGGAGSTKDTWGALPEALAVRYRVICFDCRGLGESDPGTEPLSMAAVADDMSALLDALEISQTHVLGWSFGSAVAQTFALRHPERLRALVLWSTWARTDGYLRAVFTGLRYPFALRDLETAVVVLGTVFSPELLDAPEYGMLVEQLRLTLPRDDAQIATTTAQWDASLGHDTTALLPEVTAPVLVVAGEQDTIAPPRYGRQVTELLPTSRLVCFDGPGSSHGLGLERTEEFSRLVTDFLTQHSCVTAS